MRAPSGGVAVHAVSPKIFQALATGPTDAGTMRRLMAGQRSRHALLLREVLTASRRHPAAAHAAQLGRATAALDAVQRQDPAAAAAVLGYPIVGAWAAHCLRRLRRADPEDGEVPLWVDLAHLNAVAAAAAVRARMPVDVGVPLRSGAASLPGLGQVRVPGGGSSGPVRVSGDGTAYVVAGRQGRVHVPLAEEASGGSWSAVRRWSLEDGDRRLSVVLDDVDPYRDCHGLTSAPRLPDREAERWRALIGAAWQVLCRRHPHRAEELSAVPIVLVPLTPLAGGPGVNATARDSTGAIAMSPPVDAVDLAQSLVHEFQHSKLGALLDLVDLYNLEDRRLFYSPWRADPRPLGGLLQAAYAFLAVADFWRRELDAGVAANAALARYKLARSRQQLVTVVRTLQGSGALTGAGKAFVEDLREAVDAVHDLPVPDEILLRSTVTNEHHRISWRLRNLRVPEEPVSALVDAYLAGGPTRGLAVGERRLAAATARYDEEPLDELARRDLAAPSTRTRGTRADAPGDVALLHRDYDAAAEAYLREIAADPDDVHAWAGLAVARRYHASSSGASAYREAPELVAAVYRAVRSGSGAEPPDPDAVARWLAN